MVIMGYSKGESSLSNPTLFISEFLKYVETVGIYDEFDKDAGKMVTSQGVQSLIKSAKSYLPAKLKPAAACILMRDLTDDERDKAIADSEAGRIIDMRKEFQRRMSKNNGAQGLLAQLVDAAERGDFTSLEDIMADAKILVEEQHD